jgi:hypothetical protein
VLLTPVFPTTKNFQNAVCLENQAPYFVNDFRYLTHIAAKILFSAKFWKIPLIYTTEHRQKAP